MHSQLHYSPWGGVIYFLTFSLSPVRSPSYSPPITSRQNCIIRFLIKSVSLMKADLKVWACVSSLPVTLTSVSGLTSPGRTSPGALSRSLGHQMFMILLIEPGGQSCLALLWLSAGFGCSAGGHGGSNLIRSGGCLWRRTR